MNIAYEIWSAAIAHGWHVGIRGDDVVVTPSDFSRPLPSALVDQLKKHKPEMLELLAFHEDADRLLLESSRRLAEAWPPDFDIEADQKWQSTDAELQAAFNRGDPEQLRLIIELREALAAKLFSAHKDRINHRRSYPGGA